MFHYNLPFKEYQAIDALNNSTIGLLERSPAHSRCGYYEDSAAMDFGSLLHLLVLEPHLFDDTYAVTDLSFATKEGKAFKAEAEAAGKEIIKGAVLDSAKRARDALLSHPLASFFLSDGKPEVTMTSEMEGVPVKARVDWMRPDGILIDLKTTQDASTKGFLKSIASYRYYRQAVFYSDIYEHHESCNDFIFIAVESKPPYAVQLHKVSPTYLDIGRDEYRRALKTYKVCREVGEWPAYPHDIVVHAPPAWALKEAA